MIQLEEKSGLGDGQKIETEMAKQAGLKIFRTYTDNALDDADDDVDDLYHMKMRMHDVASRVKTWYESG